MIGFIQADAYVPAHTCAYALMLTHEITIGTIFIVSSILQGLRTKDYSISNMYNVKLSKLIMQTNEM